MQQYFSTTAPPSYVSSFPSSYPLMQQASGIAIASPVIPPSTVSPAPKSSSGQKRKQVKNACVNCQKACKKCDEGRPCMRCIKYGLTDTCVDSTRKERKKGIKRGPYKRRQQNQANASTPTMSSGMSTPQASQFSPITNSPNIRTMPFNYSNTMTQFGQNYETLNQYGAYNYQNMQNIPTMFSTASSPMLPYPMMVSTQPDIIPRAMSASPPQQYSPSHHYRGRQPMTPVPSASTSSVGDSDQEDDGSKLNILSQLCSAVLDHSDPKSGADDQDYDSVSVDSDEQCIKRRHSAISSHTPPASPGCHSRTSSYDSDYNGSPMFHTGPSFGHDSPHYINGHMHRNLIYSTPNSSPSCSPTDSTFGLPSSPKVAVSNVMHQSSPAQFWPLPPLQSVVPDLYHSYHANVQGQHQENWGINIY